MIRDGDNFRLAGPEASAWALGQFFATHTAYPQMGLPRVQDDAHRLRPVKTARRMPPRSPDHDEAIRQGLARYHARRLGIRLSELAQYRNLRRVMHFTRAEAVGVIKRSRKAKP